MSETFIVRFIRADESANEDYYYNNLADAKNHYEMFLQDDSDLYMAIQLISCSQEQESVISMNMMSMTDSERNMLLLFISQDQFDTCYKLQRALELFTSDSAKQDAVNIRLKLARLSPRSFLTFYDLLLSNN